MVTVTRTTGLAVTAAVAATAVQLGLGGTAVAYTTHYADRALPGTFVGTLGVAGMTRAEVARTIRERVATTKVTLRTPSERRTATLAELGYTVDVDATVDTVFAANTSWSSYATSTLSERRIDAVVRAEPATTQAVVAGLVEQAGGAGASATVALSPARTSFVVTPARPGWTVARSSLQDVAASAARDLSSATATVELVATVPAVTTAAARHVADRANALVARPVSVSDGDEVHTPSARVKASWVRIPVTDGVPGAPTVDAGRVRAWVSEAATDARLAPRTGLRYVDSSGTVRAVRTEARNGRTVSNTDVLARAAAGALASGTEYTGRFEYTEVAARWKERRVAPGAERLAYPAADGEKWIDVDLGNHTMTAYVGATVVRGPIKMVDGSAEKPTATGTFEVYQKRDLMTMRGNNADGTRYETPNVPWTSFFHRGFALHGAPWRSSFGYSASHGCVNLPVDVAKWVYDFASIGTTVTVHR